MAVRIFEKLYRSYTAHLALCWQFPRNKTVFFSLPAEQMTLCRNSKWLVPFVTSHTVCWTGDTGDTCHHYKTSATSVVYEMWPFMVTLVVWQTRCATACPVAHISLLFMDSLHDTLPFGFGSLRNVKAVLKWLLHSGTRVASCQCSILRPIKKQ